MCMYIYLCVIHVYHVYRDQKWASEPRMLALQADCELLKVGSSSMEEREVLLTSEAISPVPSLGSSIMRNETDALIGEHPHS